MGLGGVIVPLPAALFALGATSLPPVLRPLACSSRHFRSSPASGQITMFFSGKLIFGGALIIALLLCLSFRVTLSGSGPPTGELGGRVSPGGGIRGALEEDGAAKVVFALW